MIASSLLSLLALASPLSALAVPQPRTSLLGIGDITGLVSGIKVYITLDTLVSNLVSIEFNVTNSLPLAFDIPHVEGEAGINGTVYSEFHTTFTSFSIPASGTANSGIIPNVLLTQGALATLNIIPLGYLDLISSEISIEVGPIPLLPISYVQNNISTTYELNLLEK